MAALAAGATVAGGQTAFTALAQPAAALVPVAARASLAEADSPASAGPAGRSSGAFALAHLDPGARVDVASLVKAADLTTRGGRRAALISPAFTDGTSLAGIGNGLAFVAPVSGRLTSIFGARWGRHHNGIDIANRIGTPIYAVTDGVVEESGPASGFGLWVRLRHPDGTQSIYGHINRSFVKKGQRVKAGQQIAEVGNRGESTGPHLHFEVWDANGAKLNPITWLRRHGIVL